MYDLLVISDLHLGEDIRGSETHAEVAEREANVAAFLRHYATHRDGDRPWKLVINGDMIDFVGMTLRPEDVGLDAGTPDDHAYGLGHHPLAAVAKLHRVIDRHPTFFDALARFVGLGNALAIVPGNHDADFHFESVQEAFRTAIAERWRHHPDRARSGARSPAEVAADVQIHPWFLLEEGLAWIEHGHQYDGYCSFDHVLDPVDPDSEELDVNVSHVAMRYVRNHYVPHGELAEEWGFVGYLAWTFGQGAGRALGIVSAFAAMNHRLLGKWARSADLRRASRTRHVTRLKGLAERLRLPLWKLRWLDEQRRPPATRDLGRLLSAVMLDRLGLAVLTVALVLGVLLGLGGSFGLAAAGVLGATALGLDQWLAATRESVFPQEKMKRMAAAIHTLVRTPVVVMGHAHDAAAERLANGGVYVNTGTWVAPSPQANHALTAFTHLVLRRGKSGPYGALYRWVHGRSVQLAPLALKAP